MSKALENARKVRLAKKEKVAVPIPPPVLGGGTPTKTPPGPAPINRDSISSIANNRDRKSTMAGISERTRNEQDDNDGNDNDNDNKTIYDENVKEENDEENEDDTDDDNLSDKEMLAEPMTSEDIAQALALRDSIPVPRTTAPTSTKSGKSKSKGGHSVLL